MDESDSNERPPISCFPLVHFTRVADNINVLFILEVIPLPLLLKEAVKKLNTPDPGFFIRLLKPVVEERMKTPSNVSSWCHFVLAFRR